ncbi:MAG: hypothetical protein AAFZ15_12810 [Bacteroidota bacterium]
MPNPYDDIFGEKNNSNDPVEPTGQEFHMPEDDYPENEKEPLDEILDLISVFQNKAESFSELLTHTRAVDHKVENKLLGTFIVLDDPHDQGNLYGERAYYGKLEKNFHQIINPMKELAEIHIKTCKQFNLHIDENYYSFDKEDAQVKSEINDAVDGINLQRKILGDAAEDLSILTEAMEQTEKRFKRYIDAGGKNNISASEVAIMTRKRQALTSGIKHQFDYTLFKINLLDKAAISLGFLMKETSTQYFQKLSKAFDLK